MNGAQALIRTLVDCGVDVCFTNPGTSEMHFVAALDSVPEMRGVLGLFDEATGDPIAGAQVIDSATGTYAVTTATGTVSLAFLPDGLSKLQIRKPGYAGLELGVVIAPTDTTGVTVVLSKRP